MSDTVQLNRVKSLADVKVGKFYLFRGSVYYPLAHENLNGEYVRAAIVSKILGSVTGLEAFKLVRLDEVSVSMGLYEFEDFPDTEDFKRDLQMIGTYYRQTCAAACRFAGNVLRLVIVGDDEHPATEADIQVVTNYIANGGKLINLNNIAAKEDYVVMSPKPGVLQVSVGSESRPATKADIADVEKQLAAVANDPNLTIVTHHNFKATWLPTATEMDQPFIVTTEHCSSHYEQAADDWRGIAKKIKVPEYNASGSRFRRKA